MSIDREIKWYLCGPMSGIAQCNFPAFDTAARALRALGYDIISPAELDDPATREEALRSPDGAQSSTHTWGDFLSRDVKVVADQVGGIILMPGWHKSRGALLESVVGLLGKHKFAKWNAFVNRPFPLERALVADQVRRSLP